MLKLWSLVVACTLKSFLGYKPLPIHVGAKITTSVISHVLVVEKGGGRYDHSAH